MMNNIIKRLPNLVIKSNKVINNNNNSFVSTTTLLSNTIKIQAAQQQQQQSYTSTLSKKKFDQIKEKRDEETRNLKEERERKFIEQNKISIDELPFDSALQNVQEKFEKYHALANHLVGTMFRKVQTVEELHQILKFYKTMKNSNPNYFKASHIQYIYYAFARTQQIPLFAEILIHSGKFQIFPKMNIIVKVVNQLLANQDVEQTNLAIQLLSIYKTRYPSMINSNFMDTLSKSLLKKNKSAISSSLLPLLRGFPSNLHLDLGELTSKLIIRDSIVVGESSTLSHALEVIYKFNNDSSLFNNFDNQTKATFITFEIIANPRLDQHKFSNQLNSTLSPLVTENFEKLLKDENVTENTKSNIKRAVDVFNNQSLKESLKSYL